MIEKIKDDDLKNLLTRLTAGEDVSTELQQQNFGQANFPVSYQFINNSDLSDDEKCKILEVLFKKGADVNQTYQQRVLLYEAIWAHSFTLVKFLINQGADVNANPGGGSMLYNANNELNNGYDQSTVNKINEIITFLQSQGASE